MENLTKKINIVKSTVLGLGLLALTALPLNAQKYESDYIKKNNLSYCIYGRGIKHNSHYFKKEKEENYCISKAAKKSNSYYFKKEKDEGYCVSKQAKRYNRHFGKEKRKE